MLRALLTSRLARALLLSASFGVALQAPRAASAQSSEAVDAEALRDRARALGDEGLAAFAAGDHATALARFDEAELLVPVPTLGLRAARSLEKLGRWTEAVERFQRTSRMPIDPALPETYRAAQAEAQREAIVEGGALSARLPTVRVEIEGAAAESVSMDGRALPLDRIGEPRKVDPGEHVLVARRADSEVLARIELAPGAAETVVLRWPSPVAMAPSPPPQPPSARPAEPTIAGWRGQETAGWIAAGAGVVGLSVGLVTLGLASDRQSDLDEVCVDGTCRESVGGPGLQEEVDAYNALATTSMVTLIAGAALVSLGGVLLFTAPDPAPGASRWRPVLTAGPDRAGRPGAVGGVRGTFD